MAASTVTVWVAPAGTLTGSGAACSVVHSPRCVSGSVTSSDIATWPLQHDAPAAAAAAELELWVHAVVLVESVAALPPHEPGCEMLESSVAFPFELSNVKSTPTTCGMLRCA